MTLDPNWLKSTFAELTDLQELSAEGQKWVYEGRHPDHGRIILKIYYPGSDPRRALREVRSSRVVEHDYVPESLDVNRVDSPLGSVIAVLEEHIPGRTLREILDAGAPDDQEILDWATTLLDILTVAEENEVVHRDVKPGNVIVDPDGNCWLLDFGLARHLDLESVTATEASQGVGTPGYSPPEQFMNIKEQIDGRSDLFGLGVTLHESIEGYNWYYQGAADRDDVYRRVKEESLPQISRQLTESGSVRNLIHAMTRRSQEHRPPTVEYALDWMEEIQDELN